MKSTVEMSVEQKKANSAYRSYCAGVAQDQSPKSFVEFEKTWKAEEAKLSAEKEKKNAIIAISPKVIELANAMGWVIGEYTPSNGQFEGVPGMYAKNPSATVNGCGFLRLSIGKLDETEKRLQANLDLVRLVKSNL